MNAAAPAENSPSPPPAAEESPVRRSFKRHTAETTRNPAPHFRARDTIQIDPQPSWEGFTGKSDALVGVAFFTTWDIIDSHVREPFNESSPGKAALWSASLFSCVFLQEKKSGIRSCVRGLPLFFLISQHLLSRHCRIAGSAGAIHAVHIASKRNAAPLSGFRHSQKYFEKFRFPSSFFLPHPV